MAAVGRLGFVVCLLGKVVPLRKGTSPTPCEEAAGWEEDLRRAAAEWKSLALHYGTEFEVAKMKLSGVRDELQNLRAAYDAERLQFEQEMFARQRDAFLRGHFISGAIMDYVGAEWIPLLTSFGIETAYDVEPQRLAEVPRCRQAVVECLVDWRRKVEARFHFNEAKGVPAADLHDLAMKYLRKRQELEAALAEGLIALGGFIGEVRNVFDNLDRRMTQAEPRWRRPRPT